MDTVKDQFRKSDKNGVGRISEDALAELIRKLCGDAISLEVIHGLFESFDSSSGPKGSINYDDFIEWLFQSLESTSGSAGSVARSLAQNSPPRAEATGSIPSTASTYRLFMSHQQTEESSAQRHQWLKGASDGPVKASTPPFNVREGLRGKFLPEGCVELNIATFGVVLPKVLMRLFESGEMQKLAKDLCIPVPLYAMDVFVQKKMPKCMDLVKEARKESSNLDAKNLAAADKLEAFINGFGALNGPDGVKIQGVDQWEEFVAQHVPPGWQDKLHFETVLTDNFGFDKEVADRLRRTNITVEEKGKESQVSLEQHALRWLTKAFKGYGPVGCLADVVNLIHAMMNLTQTEEADEKVVIDVVEQFEERLSKKEFRTMWIPTHLVHDAESDDALTWLLLEYIHRLLGTQLEVCIQLPLEETLDDIAAFLRSKHPSSCQVYRDKDAANGKAILAAWAPLLQQQASPKKS